MAAMMADERPSRHHHQQQGRRGKQLHGLALILLQSTTTRSTNGWVTSRTTTRIQQRHLVPFRLHGPTRRPYYCVANQSKVSGDEAGDEHKDNNDDDNILLSSFALRENGIYVDRNNSAALTPAQISLNAYVNKVKAELQENGVVLDTKEGRACVGEPSVDPSKMIAPNQGDSEWIDDW